MWWTVSASRSNRVPVKITHADGLETVSIDQRFNGGRWNSQGRFYFEAGGKYLVSIVAPPGPSSTCADAVRFQLNEEVQLDNEGIHIIPEASGSNTNADTIIDNRDSQTSKTGSWGLSGGADPYGPDAFFSRDGATFTWHFSPLKSGLYEVAMWWTVSASRSNRVPVKITHADGLETVSIDQRLNGGRWNSQGRFYFEAGGKYVVSIVAPPGPSSTCADAVRFQLIAAK